MIVLRDFKDPFEDMVCSGLHGLHDHLDNSPYLLCQKYFQSGGIRWDVSDLFEILSYNEQITLFKALNCFVLNYVKNHLFPFDSTCSLKLSVNSLSSVINSVIQTMVQETIGES